MLHSFSHQNQGWVEERLTDLIGSDPRKREIIDTLLLLDGEDLILYAKQQLGVESKMQHFAKELVAHKRRVHAQAEEEEAQRQRKQRPLKSSDPNLELYQKPVLEDEPPKKGKGKKKGQGAGNTPGGISHPTNVTVTVKPIKKTGRALKEGVRLACDCLSADHQVLTNKGFKFLVEIESYRGDDLMIAGYKEDEDAIVYEKPIKLIIHNPPPAGHEMVEFTHEAEAARWNAFGTPKQAAPLSAGAYLGATAGAPRSGPARAAKPVSNYLSLLVTEGHDMYVKTGKYTSDFKKPIWVGPNITKMVGGKKKRQHIPDAFHKMKADELVDDVRMAIKFKSLAAAGLVNAHPHRVRLAALNTDEKHTIFLELFGFWTGNGTLEFTKLNTPSQVRFRQVKTNDIAFIEKACKLLNIAYHKYGPYGAQEFVIAVTEPEIVEFFFTEYAYKYKAVDGGTGTTVCAAIAAAASMAPTGAGAPVSAGAPFSEDDAGGVGAGAVGVSMNEGIRSVKWFPPWVFELRKEDMRTVLKGLKRADGHWAGRGKQYEDTGHVIYTSSVRFRDQIVHLAILAGYSATFVEMYGEATNHGTNRNDRPIISKFANWEVRFMEEGAERTSAYVDPVLLCSRDVKRVIYHDRVWCFTMPSGFLITRRACAYKGQVIIASRPTIIGNCQAQEHALITNCLECGRIICMQEGYGPCLFCASDVESQHLVQQQRSEESAKAKEGFFKALAQRNQLVEFDRTSAQRTMVYDDQADYFSTSNSWLSETEREFAQKKEAEKAAKEGKRTMKLAFDFAGRRVMLAEDKDDEPSCDAENFLIFKNEKRNTASAPGVVPVILQRPSPTPSDSTSTQSPYAAALRTNLPAPAASSPPSKPKKGKKAVRERVQHEYYAGEETEEGSEQQQQASPFKLCGVIETLKTPWPMAERKQLIDLVGKHHMSHYFYAPVPADLAENWKSPLPADTVKNLTDMLKMCTERQIEFNFGFHMPSTFDAAHALVRDYKAVAAKLLPLAKAGCGSFTVIFADGDAANAPISEGGKNLGVLHADGLNVLFSQLQQDSGKQLHFFVGLAHRHGDIQAEKTLPKKHLYYWRDINANLTMDATVLFHGPEQLNERISHHFAAALWTYWGAKRKVVLWDLYPSNDVTPQAVFLQPYEGRSLGLENYLHGAVCSVMQQPKLSLVTLSTVFSYLHSPLKYVPLKSIKEALLPQCNNTQRQVNDLLTLIAICPSPIAPTELSETAARFLKGAAPAAVAEVESALKNALEASYASGVKEELAPFFAMCALIIELHSHKHTLRSLMKQEELIGKEDKTGLLAVATRIEAEQGAVMHAQRQLDALLWRK